MKQNLNNNYSQTLTCVEEKFIKKTHEKLYLVLKKHDLRGKTKLMLSNKMAIK